ncbi:MAG TPA: glycosyltransferase family 4 protein [bacterium]|nr:glycosyltransferase family 4 protein [bacterium]
MKVAHLICTYAPYPGGMGHTTEEIVNRLAKAQPDFKITVVCPSYGKKSVDYSTEGKYEIVRSPSWFSFGNAAIVRGLTSIWKTSDIVHFHYPFYGTDALVYFLKKRYPKTRLFIHYHMDPQASGWRGVVFSIFRKLFLARLLKMAEMVTCASLDYWENSAAGQLKAISRDRVVEIPFRVDTERFCPGGKDIKLIEKTSFNKDIPTILMVGGLDKAHYFKGVDILLQALAQINLKHQQDWQLVIVGDGDLKESYQQMAANLGIANKVFFAGRASAEELPLYYRLADIFTLPSINRCEAFGLVLLEAMASGLPCLAANLPGVRKVIDDNCGLLVEPSDIHDLAEKIFSLLSNKELRLTMGQAGRERAVAKFSASQPSELSTIYLKEK